MGDSELRSACRRHRGMARPGWMCQPSVRELLGPSTTTIWACQRGTSVGLRVISGGDHAWPGSMPFFLVVADLTPPQPLCGIGRDSSFDASRLIADFFAAHARGPSQL